MLHFKPTREFDRRVLLVLFLGLMLQRCASAPPPAPIPVIVSYEQKLAWILRLEDQRLLRDPALGEPEDTPSVEGEDPDAPPVQDGAAAPGAGSLPQSATPDLLRLIEDPSAAIRRRSAVAIGRVRLAGGIPALVSALSDPQMEVREIAAFGLGLIGDPAAAEPLVAALRDVSPVVQGRAAQALGMLGASGTLDAIQSMVAMHVTEAFAVDPEELGYPLTPRIEAFRSGLYALAALGSYDALAATILTEEGEPVLWWWPVAHALTQVDDPRAVGPLKTLVGIQGSIGVAIAARGLGALGDTSALPVLVELLDPRRRDARVVITAVRALAALGDNKAVPALRRLLRTSDLDSALLLELVEGRRRFRADFDLVAGGVRVTAKVDLNRAKDEEEELGRSEDVRLRTGRHRLRFANVDDRLCLWVDDELVDLGPGASYRHDATDFPGPGIDDLVPVGIAASGIQMSVTHLQLFRDIYYRSERVRDPNTNAANPTPQAESNDETGLIRSLDNPRNWHELYSNSATEAVFQLGPDEFLMLGDNVYIDDPTHPLTNHYCYYRRQSRPEWRRFTATTGIYSIYDDHDFGLNDCVPGAEIEKPAWKRTVWDTFRQNWVNA